MKKSNKAILTKPKFKVKNVNIGVRSLKDQG